MKASSVQECGSRRGEKSSKKVNKKLLKSTLIIGAFGLVSALSLLAHEMSRQYLLNDANSLLAENLEALSDGIEDEMYYRNEALRWVGQIDIGVGPQQHLYEQISCSDTTCWTTRTANLIKCDGEGTACAHWRIQRATLSHPGHEVHVSSSSGPEEPTHPRILKLIEQYQR